MLRIALLLMFGSSFICSAQLDPIAIEIPMRDGMTLAANLHIPDESGTYPVILIQTPYNKSYYTNVGLPVNIGFDIANSPFAVVIVDWRCFFGSTDACTFPINRGEDGYDTVEWIAEQEWCNGKIGTWGPSALGNIQFQTANEQAPHHTCAVPIVASPGTYYEKYYPGGSLRTEYFQSLNLLFGSVGNFDLIVDNPYQNLVWSFATTYGFEASNIQVPMFIVGGWYDHNTEENLELFELLRLESDEAIRDEHKIIMGPWVHGGTGQANVGSSIQGELEYPDAANRDNEMAREFFAYYLLEEDNNWEDEPAFTWFTMGLDQWNSSDSWPPENTELQTFYLDEGNLLSPQAPSETGSYEFSFDPTDPSPTIGGKTLQFGLDQGPYDQRFEVENRSDALVFSTAELTEPIELNGTVKVVLKVATDAFDTDFSIRLCDVYPDGRSMLLSEGIQRLRFRNGDYSANGEELASAGEFYEIELFFESLSIAFLPGHQIRLVISSSNYPRYNRNMNTGAEMYPNGNPDTLVNPVIAQNQVAIGDPAILSRIELPVLLNTGIRENRSIEELSLYPNPSDGLCTIEIPRAFSEVQLKVMDTRGSLVFDRQIKRAGSYQFDGRFLSPGMYQISLIAKDRIYSGKLLIQP